MANIQDQNKDGVAPDRSEVAGSDHKPLPIQTDNNNTKKFMDAKFYNAAVKGNIEVLEEKQADLDRLLTPRGNTILHIHILARTPKMESTKFLEWALAVCPSVPNIKGETPLHLAARCGDHKAVEVLVQRPKSADEIESGYKQQNQMLWVTNNEKDTALHEAVRMNHIEVVRLLINKDPEHSYSANNAGETPLYLAVHRGYNDIASEMLERCTSLTDHEGPRGTTTLHAAVFTQNYDITEKILQATGCMLTSEVDDDGWTPLHYCAQNDSLGILNMLLEKDKSAAYIPSKKEQWTPLHVAVTCKRWNMVEKLIEQCPDSVEVVDRKGWNIFHHAVNSVAEGTILSSFFDKAKLSSVLKHQVLTKQLINDKNVEGNTPLHCVASRWFGNYVSNVILKQPTVDKNALNKKNKTPLDLLLEENSTIVFMKMGMFNIFHCTQRRFTHKMRKKGCKPSVRSKITKQDEEVLGDDGEMRHDNNEKTKEAPLVAAALIATVTFAAGFTLPGGLIDDEKSSDQGSPVLLRRTSFEAFIITDAIAMVFSSCAVFLHLWMALCPERRKSVWSSWWAFLLTVIAMGAMVLAFATGTYAVLGDSLVLAISIIIISIFSFLFFGNTAKYHLFD